MKAVKKFKKSTVNFLDLVVKATKKFKEIHKTQVIDNVLIEIELMRVELRTIDSEDRNWTYKYNTEDLKEIINR